MNVAIQIFTAIFSIYVIVCITLYFVQQKLIFFPDKLPDDHVYHFDRDLTEMTYETEQGVRINALLFESGTRQGVVLYFHGNAAALDNWGFVAADFVDRGYDLCIPDYRQFGKSTGPLSERGLHHDALYIYRQLKAKYAPDRIVVYGRSLGTGIAVRLAAEQKVRKVGLETPYLSILSISKKRMPFFPVALLHRFPFRSDQYISRVDCPILMIHGTSDQVIPLESCKQLYELAGFNAELTIVPGAVHNNINEFTEYGIFLDKLLSD